MAQGSMYNDEMDQYMDEHAHVTSRWLACKLNIKMHEAKSVMVEYLKSHSELSALYMVDGIHDDSSYSFRIVEMDALEEAKSSLLKFENADIYAIYKSKTSSSLSQACASDLHCVNQALAAREPGAILRNSIGSIGCVGTTILPPGEKLRLLSDTSKSTPLAPSARSKGSTLGTAKSVPAAASLKKEAVMRQAKSFFDLPTSAKAKPKPKKDVEEEVVTPVKEVRPVPAEDEEEGEDGEWGSKYVPHKDNIKKRPVASGAPEGSGGMHEADVVFSDADEEEGGEKSDLTPAKKRRHKKTETPTRSSQRLAASAEKKHDDDGDEYAESDDDDNNNDGEGSGKGRGKKGRGTPGKKPRRRRVNSESDDDGGGSGAVVHGAMDDFIEDATNKAAAGGAPGSTSKPKRKRLVEKMFADEKGYLVTEMVLEEVSGDEGDTPQKTAKAATVPAKPKPTSQPAKKTSTKDSKSAGAPKSQQKSMTSFFTKK